MSKPSGWMRGTVAEVISGDTLVLSGAVRGGIPPKKRLTLSSLTAPRLGRRDGSTSDDPFAWESREFLRKLTIGKPVVFRVDYTLEAAGNREFGTVILNDRDNVALAVVTDGWAKVRSGGGQQSPYLEELTKAAEQAESQKLGVWAPSADAVERPPAAGDEFDAAGFLAAVGKGGSVEAIVEAAPSGSMLRVTLMPSLQSASVMVAGVQCPSVGRRPEPSPAVEGAPAVAVPVPVSEPGALEARHYTETRTLNREVKLTLEGVSQFGVLVAAVGFPSTGGSEDLATGLLKGGLAKAAEWSLNLMTTGAFRLRETERAARQARVGVWKGYVPAATASSKLSDDFSGEVAEVVSGDCLVVRDAANGVERRVNLSSVRAPRTGGRDRAPEPWGPEARELLRALLVGRPVRVRMEYTRKIGGAILPGAAAAAGEERTMAFGSVTTAAASPDGKTPAGTDVATVLVERGLATVVRHRADEERAGAYGALVEAEEDAKKGKRGVHGAKAPAPARVNDLSGNANKAKSHLPFLQRAGKVRGVVEVVLSAHKVKILVPREGVTLAFSPAGVKCPGRAQPAAHGRPATAEEPYWEEALAFTRSRVLQRDVEIEVEGVDRVGTLLGRLFVPATKTDLGLELVKRGLARLQRGFDAQGHGGPELVAAEERAKAQKLKIWESYDARAAAEDASDEHDDSGERAAMEVVVTEVRDGNTFYVQDAAEPRVSWLAQELAALDLDAAAVPTAVLRAGDKCVAKYDADGQWYRAAIEKVHAADPTAPQYDIVFMDFGNGARVKSASIRPMEASLAAVAPQARQAALAFVKAPALEAEWGVEAAQKLVDLVGDGRRLQAVVESKERLPSSGKLWGAQANFKLHLTLKVAADQPSINTQIVQTGYAKVAVPKGRPTNSPMLEEVQEAEASARQRRVGIWQYGDPGSESEDESAYPRLRSAGPRH